MKRLTLCLLVNLLCAASGLAQANVGLPYGPPKKDAPLGLNGKPEPKKPAAKPAAPANPVFAASRVGQPGASETRATLEALFAQIAPQWTLDTAGKLVTQRVATRRGKIMQRLTATRFLIEGGEEYFTVGSTIKTRPAPNWLLVTMGERNWVDGENAVGVVIEGDLFTYTDVLGAKRTVRSYVEPPGISREQFVEALKAGKTFTATLTVPATGRGTGAKTTTYTVQWE
jgi:hypothetical protein